MILYIVDQAYDNHLIVPESTLFSLFCEKLQHKVIRGEIFENIHYIKNYDEKQKAKEYQEYDYIVLSSSLVPYVGYGHNEFSMAWFNAMMADVVKSKVTGKNFMMLRDHKSVKWDCIDPELLNKAFKANNLYTTISSKLDWLHEDIESVIEFDIMYTIKKEVVEEKPVKKLKKRR